MKQVAEQAGSWEEPGSLIPYVSVASASLPDGANLTLDRRGKDWVVRVGSMVLMSSRTHESEKALAEHALARATEPGHVLVGGLGLGFTLRAVLDRVGPTTRVTVAELLPELVSWNREYVGEVADHPLADARSHVVLGDVYETLKRCPVTFDVILLDVDNGPAALSSSKNQRLYGRRGVETCLRSLRPAGVLAIWSAGPSARFERVLRDVAGEVEVLHVNAFKTGRARHVLFLARPPRLRTESAPRGGVEPGVDRRASGRHR